MPQRANQKRRIGAEDYFLLAAVVLLPWAFGGREIWAFRTASFLVALGASVALWKRGWVGWGLVRGQRGWILPAVLLAAWAAFQILPLPPALLEVLSPGAHAIYADVLPGYPDPLPSDLLGELEEQALSRVPETSAIEAEPGERLSLSEAVHPMGHWRTLSLEPSATQERLFWYLALLLGWLVVRERASHPEVAAVYRRALFVLFAALAAFALFQSQTWNGKIYWLREIQAEARPFGPYVNPTHLSGVMELAVPWIVAQAWAMTWVSWRHRAAPIHILLVAGAVLCMAASLGSGSKLGAVLIGAGLTALGLLGASTRRQRLVVGGWLLALWAIGASTMAFTPVGQRFRSFLEQSEGLRIADSRLDAWTASGQMLREFPVTGSGFGTFRQVFPHYLPPGEHSRWAQAHNDYLEFALEGGIVGVALLAWLALGFGARLVRRVARAEGDRRVALGMAIGLAMLAAHAFVDFNHQLPANALLFVTVAAMALPLPRTPARPS